jgi:putative membrane protein
MEHMFEVGFLGTKAPLFMDIVVIIVGLLPFLVGGAIFLAKKKMYKQHIFAQRLIFLVTLIVLVYFETGVRIVGGFNALMAHSSISHSYAFIVLVFHIAVAVGTLIVWGTTLYTAKKQLVLKKHKKAGIVSFIGVIATSLTGIWVYLLLFNF